MKIFRFVWLALFAFFVGLASYLAEELFFPLRPSVPQSSIEWSIHQDFKRLKEENQLPKEFEKIHQVFIVDLRKEKTPISWSEISKFHFKQRVEGQFDLHIEVLETSESRSNNSGSEKSDRKSKKIGSGSEEEKDEIILQFSLFETESKNKIWELSRSYQPPNI